MGRWPTKGSENRCHPRESGGRRQSARWIPAFAGMTPVARFSGEGRCRLAGISHRALPFWVANWKGGA
jgi:hypothetical protein